MDIASEEHDMERKISTRSAEADPVLDEQNEQILSEYYNLTSRRVDLVGDYAGSELFLVDGDSLLLRCFDDENLDFENGFQLLHAVFLVEQFLHGLRLRKCKFRIVFCNSNRCLCIPAKAKTPNAPKYLFARAALIRHLSSSLPDICPEISVHQFESWSCIEFVRYLQQSSPYFVMMHDGAQQPQSFGEKSLALRKTIINFIAKGYNIALVNELQWQDTKIMVSVLEPRKRLAFAPLSVQSDVSTPCTSTVNLLSHLDRIRTIIPIPSERLILSVITIASILQDTSVDTSSAVCIDMCVSFLLHQAFISHLPLSARRFPEVVAMNVETQFLQTVSTVSETLVNNPVWATKMSTIKISNQMADYVDGRLFFQVHRSHIQPPLVVQQTYLQLRHAVKSLVDINLPLQSRSKPESSQPPNGSSKPKNDSLNSGKLTILPFSNPVFDKHLQIVKIEVDNHRIKDSQTSEGKIFQETSHWHNARRPLARKGAPVPVDPYQAKKAARRNQRFMAEMQKYAASLTNAVGKSLDPETIVSKQDSSHATSSQNHVPAHKIETSNIGSTSHKSATTKDTVKNKRKTEMALRMAADQARRSAVIEDKSVNAWKIRRDEIDKIFRPEMRYLAAQRYLLNLSLDRNAAAVQCGLYMVNCLVKYMLNTRQVENTPKLLDIAAVTWYHLWQISQRHQVTQPNAACIADVVSRLNLPNLPPIRTTTISSDPTFLFHLSAKDNRVVRSSHQEFLLQHCGPYLERSFDSQSDERVGFSPDAWQRKVLDSIDLNESVFVVAPTSAGKTFISFYAMRKVLEADDDGVLVYVAPTKALVNQIAAEIQARYSKSFKHPGKSVWAIHTRDYRINNPNGCQILVTVPHILQIMLMSPSNAKTWSTRIKRIIFDEVHSLGQAEDGVIWEQLLLMAPCPIIALSATVGNPSEFAEWPSSTQESIGVQLNTVSHPHRYSDLRKYFYTPVSKTIFTGLSTPMSLDHASLDDLADLRLIHPVATLIDRSRGIPEDLALEPRDCLRLWQAMKMVANDRFDVSPELDPMTALPSVCRKQDVLAWERSLKDVLRKWLAEQTSPFDALVEQLTFRLSSQDRDQASTVQVGDSASSIESMDKDDLLRSTLPLLGQLHERNALPAILFNYDRHRCEQICESLLSELIAAEDKYVKAGKQWQQKLNSWEEWKLRKEQSKFAQRKADQKSNRKQKAGALSDGDKLSKLDLQRESASTDLDKWEKFDANEPQPGYHFADYTKMQASELQEIVAELQAREIDPELITALKRGIGVHHAGMNRKYRQVVEILFRRRFLHVVIATGTLALGINMPCKTVVFSGASIYLTALNYRQCAGRAGRRGFDLLGNVIFQGIARQKVYRLISSRLPSLNGHFPITTSFVLRLFILLHESQTSTFAVNAIDSVLSQPRLYMGGVSFKQQTMHHLRFSIEYLRQQNLLSETGVPINLAGLVSHLYYTENSAFAFHALMKEHFFADTCKRIVEDEEDTLMRLMHVMSHLFCRSFIRSADNERRRDMIKGSSSMIFLPQLPETALEILEDHNERTRAVFETYVQTYVDQHVSSEDNILPLTGVKLGGLSATPLMSSLPATRVRSSFVALSGHGDAFNSIHDLCSTVRSGVFLEESVIPFLQLQSNTEDIPLNAYLLDFFKHGDVVTLEKDNGIRRSDIWFHLNDFSLVLATIVTSLMNLMGIRHSEEIDMTDLQGQFDLVQESGDDETAVYSSSEKTFTDSVDGLLPMVSVKLDGRSAVRQAKKGVPDSWDDDDNDGDEAKEICEDNGEVGDVSQLPGPAEKSEQDDQRTDNDLANVLLAFKKLQVQFNDKFKAMWA